MIRLSTPSRATNCIVPASRPAVSDTWWRGFRLNSQSRGGGCAKGQVDQQEGGLEGVEGAP